MRKKKNSSYIGKFALGVVVVGIALLMTVMWITGKKEKFVLSLSDESGNVQDKTESERSEYAQDIDKRRETQHARIGPEEPEKYQVDHHRGKHRTVERGIFEEHASEIIPDGIGQKGGNHHDEHIYQQDGPDG